MELAELRGLFSGGGVKTFSRLTKNSFFPVPSVCVAKRTLSIIVYVFCMMSGI